MRHTHIAGSSWAVKGRGRALLLAFVALLLVLLGGVGGCTEKTVYTGPPGSGGANGSGGQGSGGAGLMCAAGQNVCNGQCVDVLNNALNCGSCGRACSTGGGLCANGMCACQAGLTACGTACANTMSDGNNCGMCGNVCGAGLFCSLGVCSATCAAGLTPCGNSCVNSMTDPLHCGTCNNACGAGLSCASGTCSCGTGQINCTAGCTNPLTDSTNCGTCGNVCQNGTVCTSGTCQCPDGMTCGPPGSGGAGGSGGGGGGSGGCGPGGGVEGGGYIVQGTWHGYGFTAAVDGTGVTGSSIDPANFATVTNFPLCASGTVSASYDSLAMIGWNLNEAINDECGEMNPKMTVTPTLEGIYLQLRNPGGSPLRVQIQGPNGSQPGPAGEEERWCATVSGDGGFIPFESFKLRCWAGGMNQTVYNRQPIESIIVMVPGDMVVPITYNFCVDSLLEADNDGPPPGVGCALNVGSGQGTYTLSGTATANVTRDRRDYVVQNNVWNPAANNQNQTLNVVGTGFQITEQSNSVATTGAPTGFPSVFIGSNHGHASANSGLPKRVGDLTNVPTGWRISGVTGETNAAYDVWFSTGPGGDSGNPSGGYLMVWFHDPPAAQPLGQPTGTESLAGRSWQVWTCPGACQNGVPVISYVPNGTISEMSFDLNDFIQNAVTDYPTFVSSNWYLTNVFAGFEVWSGGLNSRSHEFCAIVE